MEPLADALLAAVRDVLVASGTIDAAFVFGPVAHGQAHPESEVDIAVRLAHGTLTPEQRLDLLERLGIATGRAVRFVDLATVDAALRRRVFAEGRVLFDSDPDATRQVKKQTLFEYFDWVYACAVVDKRPGERLREARTHG